jgi:very-short-patch-repair endonuclease
MSLPEVLLWRELKANHLHFRKQHEAGDHVLDFFCARANLAVEIDGFSHSTGRRERDEKRDAWPQAHRIDTIRTPASDVLRDPAAVARGVVAMAVDRLERFGKTPPSSLRLATSPSQVDGEDLGE